MKGRENSSCTHNRCAIYNKDPELYKPQHGPYITERNDFGSFEKFEGHSADWIMALNPYYPGTKERNEFEEFRQGRTELRAHGEWPANRDTFHRSEVSVEFIEVVKSKPAPGKWIEYCDVEEAAVYVGKAGMIGDHYLDVLTPNFDKSNVHFTRELSYLTLKQADDVLAMFDNKEAYAKNFTALKTIARGFYDLIQERGLNNDEKVSKMFHVINKLQSALLPDSYQEMESIR